MALNADAIKSIVKFSLVAPERTIGCYECLDQIDCYVETVLEGKELSEALQLVEIHLKDCPECKEEFEALHAALLGLMNESQ